MAMSMLHYQGGLFMIQGFVYILIFQAVGELCSQFFLPKIPGPVIGLVLMLVFLSWRGEVPSPIENFSNTILPNLGLFFIPAAVGVVMYLPLLKTHAGAVMLALLLGVLATLAVTALILKFLATNRPEDEHAN